MFLSLEGFGNLTYLIGFPLPLTLFAASLTPTLSDITKRVHFIESKTSLTICASPFYVYTFYHR